MIFAVYEIWSIAVNSVYKLQFFKYLFMFIYVYNTLWLDMQLYLVIQFHSSRGQSST